MSEPLVAFEISLLKIQVFPHSVLDDGRTNIELFVDDISPRIQFFKDHCKSLEEEAFDRLFNYFLKIVLSDHCIKTIRKKHTDHEEFLREVVSSLCQVTKLYYKSV